MRRWNAFGLGIVVAIVSAQPSAAEPGLLDDSPLQALVRTQAISARCQKTLPGLKPQLLDARSAWVSKLDAPQLQAAEAYANSKDGKKLAKATDSEASQAFGRNVFSAAATCIGLLKDFDVAYPSLAGTAMPAANVRWHLDNFAPMVLASLKCARLDGIDVEATPSSEEIWRYRGCGRVEVVRVAPRRPIVVDGRRERGPPVRRDGRLTGARKAGRRSCRPDAARFHFQQRCIARRAMVRSPTSV